MDYIIYCDGCCLKNPGGRGGYGTLISDGVDSLELSEGFISTTNNRMELMGAIRGVEAIPPYSTAIVYSDSQYVVKTMLGQFKKGKNQDLWQRMENALVDKQVNWKWVKGHSGIEGNERCDAIALKAATSLKLFKDVGYELIKQGLDPRMSVT